MTLPISSMVQVNDSTIVIATGESYYPVGNRHRAFTAIGRGLFLFNTNSLRFTPIEGTAPTSTSSVFATVNNMETMQRNGVTYLLVATNQGLYRWEVRTNADWATYTTVSTEKVDQVMVIGRRNLAMFSSGNRLFKIGNVVDNSQPVDISSSNSAFGGTNTRIYLAYAPTDNNYIYAMVANQYGLFENVYLTTNQQTWQPLATSTVVPFSYNTTATCGALYVDPTDCQKIYIGGTSVFVGKGYTEGYYQWTQTSYDENSLNGGDFMANVFSSTAYVHSGINQIVSSYSPDRGVYYYVATDGGVFLSYTNCQSFVNISRGLNGIQVNGLAVSPDGALTIGANQYAVPYIASRFAHSKGDTVVTWYDDGELGNMNHLASVLWYGNGGQTAASMFQQVKPTPRRTIFTSAQNGAYGRSYADYSNYTNTQTWTTSETFYSNAVTGGPAVGVMALWETLNDTIYNDTIFVPFDTLGVIYRGNDTINLSDSNGSRYIMKNFTINQGDRMYLSSAAQAGYPFEYVFPKTVPALSIINDTTTYLNTRYVGNIKVKNPFQARMFIVAQSATNLGGVDNTSVLLSWMPTDFRKAWSAEANTFADQQELMRWSTVYTARDINNEFIQAIAVSDDGLNLYIAVNNPVEDKSYIVRISDFDKVDYSLPNDEIMLQLGNGGSRRLSTFTYLADGNDKWFGRQISSLAVSHSKDEVVVTFQGFSDNCGNVMAIGNASSDTTYSINYRPLPDASIPVYSSMVEFTTGDVYVGTEYGVFRCKANNFTDGAVWNNYGEFNGVPVTSIIQQTHNMPVVHFISHTGINADTMIFAKTKWPYAIYFGTYGRGVFVDLSHVTDSVNEIVDSTDWLDIPRVTSVGRNSMRLYPNPAVDNVNIELELATAGNASLVVYDLAGRKVLAQSLGTVPEGRHLCNLDCSKLAPGMYLVNLKVGNSVSAAKMVVK